jgi:hypothetical protein
MTSGIAFVEFSVTGFLGTAGEAVGAGLGLAALDRVSAARGFVPGRFVELEIPLFDRRQAIVAHATLWQERELVGECEGFDERSPRRGDAVGEPDPLGLDTVDAATGEDQVHRPAVTDQPRQVDRAAIDQRHAEPPAEDTEHGVAGDDTEVAPQGQLQPACHGGALDGGDHRLRQRQPGRSHRPGTVVADGSPIARGERLEVGAGAEVTAGTREHGDGDGFVGVEGLEGGEQFRRHGRVDGVAPVGTIHRDDPHPPVVGDDDSACGCPPAFHGGHFPTSLGQTAVNMRRLYCPTCNNEVFFDSMRCVRSDTALAIDLGPGGALTVSDADVVGTCAMRDQWRCNWRPDPTTDGEPLCASCRIVDPGGHADNRLLVPFLVAQRRALSQLGELGIDWIAAEEALDPTHPPLRFTYRSSMAGDPATIGHLSGLITLDLDEADPAQREQIRATLGEQYRTPLGHIRHELGHYVWLRYVASDHARHEQFKTVFGDESADYRQALDAHYAKQDDGSWRDHHVSFYASAHPWEDFAESWAQVMHIHDVVSTGAAWHVVDQPAAPFDPKQWMSTAVLASLAANELARAMGMRDLYPFALSPGARRKIEAAWQLVSGLTPAPA